MVRKVEITLLDDLTGGAGGPDSGIRVRQFPVRARPHRVDVTDDGGRGPVDVQSGCCDVRIVFPGNGSEPVPVCRGQERIG